MSGIGLKVQIQIGMTSFHFAFQFGQNLPVVIDVDNYCLTVYNSSMLDMTRMRMELDAAQELWPETWRSVYTRHIEAPGGHYSYRVAAAAMTNAIECYTSGMETHATAAVTSAASVLAAYGFPTYFVGTELLQAIKQSNLPPLTWDQMKMPQMAAVYMLPIGALHDAEGAEVPFVGYALGHKGRRYYCPNKQNFAMEASEDKIVVFWASYDGSGLSINDCTLRMSQQLAPSADWISEQTELFRAKKEQEDQDLRWDGHVNPEFSSYLCGLLVNVLLLQTTKPELVERGERTGKRIKAGGDGLECYTPNFIGRHYRVRREHSEATGRHFTELRWRAGHYRLQWHGAGRTEWKTIWVEPYQARSAGIVAGGTATGK